MQQRLARFLADPAERLYLSTRGHQQASELNLPLELVLSVIEVESTSSGSLRYPNKVHTARENHWRTAPLDW